MSYKTIKYMLNVIIIIFMVAVIVLYNIYNREGFATTPLSDNKADSFCKSNSSSSNNRNKKCNQLTKNNCNLTSCCVWTSDEKCVAGNEEGPIFNTDNNGKTKNLDYYYYKNICHGSKCS